MATCTGTVSQTLSGFILTFLDTGTYSTVTSRQLQINDANGNPIITYNMGTNLTQTYDITADQWLSFILTVTDDSGVNSCTVNYLSTAFYDNAFVNTVSEFGCCASCSEELTNADISQLFRAAAARLALGGLGVAAQKAILAAYSYIS